MGNYNVLKNLINFAKSEYEAEQYALIIWGHGTGWRYSALPEGYSFRIALSNAETLPAVLPKENF